ncbi:MAG: segregation/condensation protein A, partial [Pirellulales bacterium]
QERFGRVADDSAERIDPAEAPLREVELWDLVSAFGRIIRETNTARPSSIIYDDTPIHVYMSRIVERLRSEGAIALSQLFPADAIKSAQIGMFLAVLELVRHHHVRADQNDLFGEIWILPSEEDAAGGEVDFSQVDNYEHGRSNANADGTPRTRVEAAESKACDG